MKKKLLDFLICPTCLPEEYPLESELMKVEDDDIIEAILRCPQCYSGFHVRQGIAFLDPAAEQSNNNNKYELDEIVSSYLWSHYGDLLDDEQASDAYSRWAAMMTPHPGITLDLGGAVGRFAFEMSTKCDLAVGIDNSVAFIRTARELMKNRKITFPLKIEGNLTRDITVYLPAEWRSDRVDFVVGNAQQVPFRSDSCASLASLNLIDKVPKPIEHLAEMNRVATEANAQFLLSDPFSWSVEAAEEKNWLGGTDDGPFAGRGLENISRLLSEGGEGFTPQWTVEDTGSVWWKIRTHTNHYELIQSCFVKASR